MGTLIEALRASGNITEGKERWANGELKKIETARREINTVEHLADTEYADAHLPSKLARQHAKATQDLAELQCVPVYSKKEGQEVPVNFVKEVN